MKAAQKRVVVSGLIVLVLILLAASFVIGIKLFPTFYDHDILNNSLQAQETFFCNLGQSCSYDRSLTLPEDYLVFGDNNSLSVLTVKCISMNDTWEMDSVIGSVISASGITTNTTNGQMPEDIWTVSYSWEITHNFDSQYNISIRGTDLDYDADRRTIWVIGADGPKFIEEYNITDFQRLNRLERSDIFYYPITVHGDFIYAGHKDQTEGKVVKINKYTNELDTIINCDCCPEGKTLTGLETVNGNYLWWVYENGTYDNIIRTNMNGDCEDGFTLDVKSIGGMSFNWADVDNFNVSWLNTIWVADSGQGQFQVWRRGGNPRNVSVTIGSQIFELIDNDDTFECNAPHDIKISYDILNDEINGSWKIPFYFNLSELGSIEYSNINIYADNQSFPVKIVYPEPDSYHDTTLNVSIYVDTAPTSACTYTIDGQSKQLGTPSAGVISDFTIYPENILTEGNISLSFYCPGVGSGYSDYVKVIYDKGYPSIDFDSFTKSIIGGSFGQASIYFAIVGDDPTEKNTTFYLYDSNLMLKNTIGGKGLRSANLSVAGDSGLYYFNVTMVDEFGRSNTTFLGNITVDSQPPYQITQSLNTTALDMNYQAVNISGHAFDDLDLRNATTIITWPNNTQEIYTNCINAGTDCSFSIAKTLHQISGNYSVQTIWYDLAGNDAYSDVDYFYARDKASIDSDMKPDGTIIVESKTGDSLFYVNTTMKNTGAAGAYFSKITLTLPSGWTSNYTNDTADCSTIYDECNIHFEITIPEEAPSTTSPMWAEFEFMNPDGSKTITTDILNVKVTPNKATTIEQDSLSNSSMHNVEDSYIGYFTVTSVGNSIAGDIITNYSGGDILQGWLSFKRIPYFSYIGIGESRDVTIEASIPAGTQPGIYSTTVHLYSDGVYRDDLNLSITILPDLNWTIAPVQIPHQSLPTGTSGFFDSFSVTNIGNVNLTFVAGVRSETLSGLAVDPDVGITIEAQDSLEFDLNYAWPPTLPGGNYLANVTVTETTSPPTEKYSFINVTLLDTPPDFNSFEIPQYTEIYEPVTAVLNITDNINSTPDVWGTFTLPNGTTEDAIIQLNYDYSPPLYEITYVPYLSGIYELNVWADDGIQSPSNLSKTFESIAKTFFSISNSINNSYKVVEGITWDDGYTFAFNISINNTGKVNGSIVIINISYPDQLSDLEPPEYYRSTLEGFEDLPFNMTVPAGTRPGTYTVTPAVNWRNPDGSYDENTTLFNVHVTSNKIISIPDDSVNLSLKTDVSSSLDITISSIGNDNLSDIIMSCQSGVLCSDFDITFSSNNFDLNAGDDEVINIAVSVPYLYDAGTYPITINASAEDDALYSFNIIVEDDDSWLLSPDNLTADTGADSQGYAGKINIANRGNMLLSFNLTVSDESVLTLGDYDIHVLKNSSTDVDVFYTAPETVGNHSFNVTVFNNDYSITEDITGITINVINFSVAPISISPNKNILPDDTIHIRAEAYYENNTLDDNVNWTIKINKSDCQVINYTYIIDAWDIFCNAPDLSDGLYYDMDIIGLYENYNAEYTDTSEDAVHYKDITSPVINSTEKEDVINSSNVTLSLNSSDNIDVVNSWVEIRYPNSTKINYSMDYINKTYEIELESPGVGDYDIIYYTNDSGGNIASKQDWFEVYIPINFSGDVLDADNLATGTVFRLYRPETDTLLYEFVSNTTEGFNLTQDQIHRRVYDINITVPAVDIELFNVSVDEITLNPIDLDNVEGEEIIDIALHKPLVGIGVVNNFTINGYYQNYTPAENETEYGLVNGYVTIHYNGTVYSDENSITVFKCPDWDYYSRNCQSSWIEQNKTIDVVANTIKVKIDSFSGYMAAENRCGNGVCEIAYAETISTCSLDCKPAPPTTVSSGGGGGGISRRTLEDALAKYNTSFNVSEGTELGFNISKEIKAALESPTQIHGVKVATTSIYRELFPGEELSTGIILRNVREDQTVEINARTVGTVKDFIVFQNETVRLKPLQEINFGITIAAPVFAMAGSYEGSIILESGGRSLQIPVSLRIQEKTEKLLDMKIQPLVNTIPPGEDLRLQIDVYNLGKTARVDITLAYQLVDAHTEEIITEKQESLAIETTLSQIRTLHIPEGLRLGNYLVRGISSYVSYNKTIFASSLAYVTVAEPWYIYELFGVIPVWIIMSILMFVLLNAAMFWAYKQYEAKKRKYKIALDLKELPQPGERTAYIGHVAETSIRTFLDIDKMQTHSIVAGSTGGGKTVAAQVLVEEALRNKVAVIVFDPTAQWTGFLRPCTERRMLKYYPKYQMKTKQAQAFNGNIHQIEDARQIIDAKKFMKPGEINIFSINKLKLQDLDTFVANTIRQMFELNLEESPNLKLIIVYDEVHRLLPKFGGTGVGFMQIERACREFRKWGIGLILISQVLSDFIGSIKANINTEVQVRTRDEGDLDRIKTKYGEDLMRSIVKASVGTGMFQNSAYNKGRPYFVEFRPLLHSITRLSDDDLAKYQKFNERIEDYDYQMEQLEQEKIDVFDIRLELKLALDKLKVGKFNMVNIYLEGLEPRLKKHWEKLGKEPKKKEIKLAKVEDIQKAAKEAEKARKEFEKQNKGKAGAEEPGPELQPAAEEPVEEPGEEPGEEPAPAAQAKVKKAAARAKQKPAAKPKAKKTVPKPAIKKVDPVEQLEDQYNELKEKLSAKRKQGADTSMIEISMKSIPADIKMFAAMGDSKIQKKILKKIADIKKKL